MRHLPLRQCFWAVPDSAVVFPTPGFLDWLSRADKFSIKGYGNGGEGLAANEHALAEAQLVLKQAFGSLVAFGEPTVHTYVDGGEAMVPVMLVRVDAPRAHAAALLARLSARRAVIDDAEARPGRMVVRAAARLSDLLGFHREFLELTEGSGHVLCWLDRYERVDGFGGDCAVPVAVAAAGAVLRA
jgi:translation elongation factor EF-G